MTTNTFQLDTSGAVTLPPQPFANGTLAVIETWGHLSPFTQGYIEALMRELFDTVKGAVYAGRNRGKMRFDWLAPETLARIIADCEAVSGEGGDLDPQSREDGADYWGDRQSALPHFVTTAPADSPYLPLTVTLGDDGKVRFA